MQRVRTLALAALLVAPAAGASGAESMNGFSLESASIPLAEIVAGGPPRDGIPALVGPATVPASEAPWSDDAMVIGVAVHGEARAYPIPILNWHELVNDTLGDRPILVTFCPLCGTGMVFERSFDGVARTFGVSGLLYQSDVLLYDRESESLWSQIASRAISGEARGTRLRLLRSRLVTWGRWKRDHPGTRVLSEDTGHNRDYGHNPYLGYATSERLVFATPSDDRYHNKMPTIGLRLPDGPSRAYPASEVTKDGGRIEEVFQGHPVVVSYDPNAQIFEVEAPPQVEVIEAFWFAWAVFHPETTVFVSEKETAVERP